jgi:creatinine amidohydrolase
MELAQDFSLAPRALAKYQRGSASIPVAGPGSVGRPTLATAEKGARVYKMIRDRIATRVLGAYTS